MRCPDKQESLMTQDRHGKNRAMGFETTAIHHGDGLVRLSVGLESLDAILEGLSQALDRVKGVKD